MYNTMHEIRIRIYVSCMKKNGKILKILIIESNLFFYCIMFLMMYKNNVEKKNRNLSDVALRRRCFFWGIDFFS